MVLIKHGNTIGALLLPFAGLTFGCVPSALFTEAFVCFKTHFHYHTENTETSVQSVFMPAFMRIFRSLVVSEIGGLRSAALILLLFLMEDILFFSLFRKDSDEKNFHGKAASFGVFLRSVS